MALDDGKPPPIDGDNKPSLKNTVRRMAKVLWRIAIGAAVKSTANDIYENIEDLFSDVEVVKEYKNDEIFDDIEVVKEGEKEDAK